MMKIDSEKILEVISDRFKDLSDKEKIHLGLKAKKWARDV
jgi:predicted metallopeptidase